MRPLVIIESPYAGDIEKNLAYARSACAHSTKLGERPFASHLFYTQFLDDSDPFLRQLGIEMGYQFWDAAEQVVFYMDLGVSRGMEAAMRRCMLLNFRFSCRKLP